MNGRQSEALRLASIWSCTGKNMELAEIMQRGDEMARELRRQHARIAEMEAAADPAQAVCAAADIIQDAAVAYAGGTPVDFQAVAREVPATALQAPVTDAEVDAALSGCEFSRRDMRRALERFVAGRNPKMV